MEANAITSGRGINLSERYTQMGSTKIAAPPPRDYGEDMASTLRAQAEAMGGTGRFSDIGPLVDLEAEQRPKYVQLELDTLRDTMLGTGGSPGMLSLYRDYITPSLSETEAGQLLLSRHATDHSKRQHQQPPGSIRKL